MDHLTTDEVAVLTRGELPEARLAHAAGCDRCADLAAAPLAAVSAALATGAAPVMPVPIAARLAAAIADEGRRRTSGEAEQEAAAHQAAHAKRLSLGSFGDNSPHRSVLSKAEGVGERQPEAARRRR